MAVTIHAGGHHGAVQCVQRGEQRCRSVALVVVRHGLGAALLHRQPRLSAIERLNLALFVEGKNQRMLRRIQIQADHVFQLLGKPRIVAKLERVDAMRLEAMRSPDAPYAGFADARGCGHRAQSTSASGWAASDGWSSQ
jgi:hypothetical protein